MESPQYAESSQGPNALTDSSFIVATAMLPGTTGVFDAEMAGHSRPYLVLSSRSLTRRLRAACFFRNLKSTRPPVTWSLGRSTLRGKAGKCGESSSSFVAT